MAKDGEGEGSAYEEKHESKEEARKEGDVGGKKGHRGLPPAFLRHEKHRGGKR